MRRGICVAIIHLMFFGTNLGDACYVSVDSVSVGDSGTSALDMEGHIGLTFGEEINDPTFFAEMDTPSGHIVEIKGSLCAAYSDDAAVASVAKIILSLIGVVDCSQIEKGKSYIGSGNYEASCDGLEKHALGEGMTNNLELYIPNKKVPQGHTYSGSAVFEMDCNGVQGYMDENRTLAVGAGIVETNRYLLIELLFTEN